MKATESIRVQNRNFVDQFLRRKGIITFAELFIFILIGIVLGLTSCSPVLYTTVGQNVALFHQKGEIIFNGNLAATKYSAGAGFQLAVAIDSSTEIMSSYYSLSNETSQRNYFEFGAGKFKYNSGSDLCGELILGLGLGSIKNSVTNNNYNYSSNYDVSASYLKPFIQPSVGFSGKIIDIAFTPRIALVSYTSKTDDVSDLSMRNNLSHYFSVKQNTFVFEPGVTFRVGYKNAKLEIQYNHTSFNYTSTNSFDPVDKDFISMGLHILITNRWSSLKSKN